MSRPCSAPFLLAALVLGACAQPATQPGGARRQVSDACRAEADRVIERRDRGDLLRQDERSARIGVGGGMPPPSNSEELRRAWDRDRMAAECERGALNPAPEPRAEPPRAR
ncbi:hypothetical protein C8P66_101260 [Humitalea rosea]|uniref:Lipoprotein n=1 Tax=Humitalea rosea TaxID=990373 RepID=A0A2W7JG48_9PROT|nr:hypothetical protein [Humitalea rosea]PZW51043.1 hypothetical protein C8P66_101260 [Humitalea rosea]